MKLASRSLGLVVAVVIAGCGGGNLTYTSSGGRGEGNIPAGRVKTISSRSVVVQAEYPGGQTELAAIDASGTFWLSRLPSGTVKFHMWTTSRDVEPKTYTVVTAPSSDFVISAFLPPRGPHDVVGVEASEFGGPLNVGERRKVVVTVHGENSRGIQPTIWVNGGVGSIAEGGVFVATRPGTGVVRIEICGFTATVPVVVK
jgi:hypothetical protein